MLQETLRCRTKFVVKQMLFAYVNRLCDTQKKKTYFLKIDNVFVPAFGDRDANDLRQNSSALFPPEYYIDFLHQASIQSKIGAEVEYEQCSDAPYNLFVKTGDVRLNL